MTKNLVSLTAIALFAAAAWACGDNAAENRAPAAPPAATNAAKPAGTNAATNAAAAGSGTAMLVAIPADVQPIFSAKCAMCHGQDAKGGPAAPNIWKVDEKHPSDEWVAYLKNTKIWEKDNKMPNIQATDDEYKKLGDWLATAAGKEYDGKDADEKGEKGAPAKPGEKKS